jgi:hypothetical protein
MLTEQGQSLQGQADTALENAKQSYVFGLTGADGLEDQADVRQIFAYQKWLQGGAPKKAQANLLRESARSVQLDAYELGVRAELTDLRAESARSRERQFHAAAEALLASGADAETRSIARDMHQQGDAEGRRANVLENESATLLRRQESTEERADRLIARAVELEATSP